MSRRDTYYFPHEYNAKDDPKCERLISVMGMGNKLHPELLQISDINKTSVCPLCKVMRRELKKRNVKKLTVVYSTEEPKVKYSDVISSCAFVPAAAGVMAGSRVINDLIG